MACAETGDWRLADCLLITACCLPFTPYCLLSSSQVFFLGLTFYTYIPARGLWLLFPVLLLVGGLWPTVPGCGGCGQALCCCWWRWRGGLAAPLLAYLRANPAAEIRIQELSEPVNGRFPG